MQTNRVCWTLLFFKYHNFFFFFFSTLTKVMAKKIGKAWDADIFTFSSSSFSSRTARTLLARLALPARLHIPTKSKISNWYLGCYQLSANSQIWYHCSLILAVINLIITFVTFVHTFITKKVITNKVKQSKTCSIVSQIYKYRLNTKSNLISVFN